MKKQEFKEKAKLNIDKAENKIEGLKLKMKEAKLDAKAEYEEQIQNLKGKKSALEAKRDKLSNITDDKWDDTKEDFIETMQDLKAKIKNIFD